ncbi:hypothetical protein RR48_11879 [Papilio machaon]|uniref:Uncharacterized protein n=1 Tax=Papilio machaon TaxID=76193 RepID=A0A194RPS9_PAPMA|nr:hypothetical protein RR48_11879 [Papilio machaon]
MTKRLRPHKDKFKKAHQKLKDFGRLRPKRCIWPSIKTKRQPRNSTTRALIFLYEDLIRDHEKNITLIKAWL